MKIIIMGHITSINQLTGPGKITYFLSNYISKEYNENVELINTYCKNIKDYFYIFKVLLRILFSKNMIVNIHSFGYLIPLAVYFVSIFNNKNKYFLTLHGITSLENEINNRNSKKYKLFIEKILINGFPNIITVSNNQKEILKIKYSRERRVYCIYNGIEITNSNIENKCLNKNEIKLITAGGVSKLKGTMTLIEYIHIYNNKNSKRLTLDIYGKFESSEMESQYYNLVDELNLKDSISYHGLVSNESIKKAYLNSDFCVAMSLFDTFNMTILESMACGTPPIVSNKVGISEIITSDLGLIIDTFNNGYYIFETFFNNLDDNRYNRLSKNCIQTSKEFSWNVIARKYIELFQTEQLEKE